MARCPMCGSEALEEIDYNTYRCQECGFIMDNPDDIDLVEQEDGEY